MKTTKNHLVTVRLNEAQYSILLSLISEGKAKSNAEAVQYLINQKLILG
jgi:Arc/MetJ-type ribon-helix-helix transcriptional regulator